MAFESTSNNLIPNDPGGQDIFVYDRQTHSVACASPAADGTQANSLSYRSSISDDGHSIAFASYASNLVAEDTNGRQDVFAIGNPLSPPAGPQRVTIAGGEHINGANFGNHDTAAPSVGSLSPADRRRHRRGRRRQPRGDLQRESVLKGAGNIVLKKSSDNSVIETIAVTSAQVTVAGAQVTIDPSVTLSFGTGYYVQIDAGAFSDLSQNPFAGISGAAAWNFTTAVIVPDHFDWSRVPGQTAGAPFSVTVTAKDAAGAIVAGFNGTANLTATATATAQVTVGTGTGTFYCPLRTSYDDSRSQVIYLQSELGTATAITGLALDVTTVPGQTLGNWTIRLKHTSMASYTTATFEDTGWTTVYHANTTISATGWTNFVFSTPFAYDGTDNLLVDFSHNNSSHSTTGYVHYTSSSAARWIYAYSNSADGDPLAWSSTLHPSVFSASRIPNLRFTTSTTTSIPVTPAITDTFVNGVWSGSVAIALAATGVVLRADDGAGHAGSSNSFDVVAAGELRTIIASADGYANDNGINGSFETLHTTEESIVTRKMVSTGEDRGLLEFDISALLPGTTLVSATLRLSANSLTTSGSLYPSMNVYAYAGDGSIALADATASGTLAGSAMITDVGALTITLDPAVIQTIRAGTRYLGLRLQSPTTGNSWESFVSIDAAFFPSSYYPALILETSVPSTGEIRGAQFSDLDGDAAWDTGEPALSGWEVYLDVNLNGHWDSGEPKTVTDANGAYALTGLGGGAYSVAEVPQAGWNQTAPASGAWLVQLTTGQVVSGINFGNHETIAPALLGLSPADNATGVARNVNLVMTFGENVRKGAGNIVIKRSSDNVAVETIPLTSTQVTIAGAQVTIDPAATLAMGTAYYVQVDSGAVEDLSGNDFAGIADATTWSFTTMGNQAPAATDDSYTIGEDGTLNVANVGITNGLVIRYAFDESTGTSAADTGTPPAATGALNGVGHVLSTRGGDPAMAADFTSGTNQNNYVTAGDPDKIDQLANMTICLWVNMRENPKADDRLLSKRPPWSPTPPAGTRGWNFGIYNANASDLDLYFGIYHSEGTSSGEQGTYTSIGDASQKWVFVAMSFADADRQLGLYSGSELGSVTRVAAAYMSYSILGGNASDLRIGGTAFEPTVDHTPPAWMDDVRVYNRVLSVSELDAIRREGLDQLGGVLANDADPDGDPISAVLVDGPTHGSLSLNADGSFNYVPNPNFSGVDTFTYKARDGAAQSNVATVTINVTPANDAPVLDNTGAMTLSPINQGDLNSGGSLVQDIIASAGGDRITDVDAGALEGIAVTAANNSGGIWQYSLDNGTSWNALGTPSAASALLLASDAATRLRFVPDAGYSGTLDPGVTFCAWDQTTGAAGGTADTTANGGTTAFSTATETASITITPQLTVVTNTSDTGTGSLRAALEYANATAGVQTISFNIPGAGVHIIQPATPLPFISGAVIIDGTTQPGYGGTPLVEINGASAGAAADGLHITAGGSTVSGLAVYLFAGDGIELAGGSNSTIVGCYLGTDAGGTLDRGNGLYGLRITASPNNTIGGTTAGLRNVISGNDQGGIVVSAATATGNQVQGNYIGTTASGTAALKNGYYGIMLSNAPANTIGGTAAGAGNVISANGSSGIYVAGSAASGNQVQGNYIGTTASGAAALGNKSFGVYISNAAGNTVGGVAAGAGNVISAQGHSGIYVSGSGSSGTVVQGNYIGTDKTGTLDLGNVMHGVFFDGAGSGTIGGTTAGARNVISGNDSAGIVLSGATATGNQVQGNYIGTTASGAAALKNGYYGIMLSSAPANTIGGTAAAAGNVISANGQSGVYITGSTASGNVVQGNLIGTDVSGTADLGNTSYGVYVDGAGRNTIGGTTAGARNVISGNDVAGLRLSGGHGHGQPGAGQLHRHGGQRHGGLEERLLRDPAQRCAGQHDRRHGGGVPAT